MLHSMTIRLIHVHQLETLYLCYGVKCQSGVIWGLCGQKVIFTLNALTCLCYTSTYVMGSMSIWGHIRSLGSKGHFTINAIIRLCYTA